MCVCVCVCVTAGYNNSMNTMQVNIKETWEGRTDLGGFWSYDINLYSLDCVTIDKMRKCKAIYSLKRKSMGINVNFKF